MNPTRPHAARVRHRLPRGAWAAVAAAVVGLVPFGCGSGDTVVSSGPPPAPPNQVTSAPEPAAGGPAKGAAASKRVRNVKERALQQPGG